MSWTFTHLAWLWLALPSLGWVVWWHFHSDVQIGPVRRGMSLALRLIVLSFLVLALAGLQQLREADIMNVFFLVDRSQSVSGTEQDKARHLINRWVDGKEENDRGGLIVFGTEAAIESTPQTVMEVLDYLAVVPTDRTDIAGAIRLATAAFPESGQKRIVLFSDGNENLGDSESAVLASIPLGVSVDVVPMGVARKNDISIQKISIPSQLKKGQSFEVKVFTHSDEERDAVLRFYQNEELVGSQNVHLQQGMSFFSIPRRLDNSGFYGFEVQLEGEDDSVPQNNRSTGYTTVSGDPRILVISSSPDLDKQLVAALGSSKVDVDLRNLRGFPDTLAELQSFDAVFLSNVSAGDLGENSMNRLVSATRDFGVGLVCIGGDNAYGAGGYRKSPLETVLPVSMELDSKKVLPRGGLVLVMHGMEFNNGNQVARTVALGVLDTLSAGDELGVTLWDGSERWLYELQSIGDKQEATKAIAGMNQGDMPSFVNVIQMAHNALKKSTTNLKHIIVFSDGDPNVPSQAAMDAIFADKITLSTVMIGGHVRPDNMSWMAEQGGGRFYNVDLSAVGDLPQIFIKEAAIILKSAIMEEPFIPQMVASSEVVRGFGSAAFPQLLGYVSTTPKPRAETPLLTHKGDPLLAHWQFGLGRVVAFTSDAKSLWAKPWMKWDQFRQFWSQIAQWSLRRINSSHLDAEVTVRNGMGHLTVEALSPDGDYLNFLNLESVVVHPDGGSETIRLEQIGPGFYEGRFPVKEMGSYFLHLRDLVKGKVRSAQALGTSVSYSPEFMATTANRSLLQRISTMSNGLTLQPDNTNDNPFLHHRARTQQPFDLWKYLLMGAIILFPLDVGIRRIQIDRDEWNRLTANLRRLIPFHKRASETGVIRDQSMSALLATRERIRRDKTERSSSPERLFNPVSEEDSIAVKHASKQAVDSKRIASKKESPDEISSNSHKKQTEVPSTTGRLLAAKRRIQQRKGLNRDEESGD